MILKVESTFKTKMFHGSEKMKSLAVIILFPLITSVYSEGNYNTYNFIQIRNILSKQKSHQFLYSHHMRRH